MRNSILLAVILTLVVSVTVPAFADVNDANKAVVQKQVVKMAEPIGWWKLNEKEGNTVSDSSGNGFNATVQLGGGPSIWTPGQGFDSSGCATFTGQQTVLIPNGVWGKVKQQLSIAFWVNQDVANPPGEQWPGPWGCAPTEGLTFPDPNWLPLRAFVPTPNKTIDIGKDSEHVFWEPFDSNTYAGTWNLYVFVKDSNEHSLRLYHNGVPVASNFDAMEPMPKINNFFLGGREYPTANWFGKIDDFRIYNTALSQDDVQKLFESKPAKAAK
ncbi:MAG: LamG domain-containing protein [Sedimentisphaerales bacterium]|jgi:hypothetical protein